MLKSSGKAPFLSLDRIRDSISEGANLALLISRRFTLALISAVGLFICLYQLVSYSSGAKDHSWEAFNALTFALGIPLFTAMHLFWEKYQTGWLFKMIMTVLAIGFLVVFRLQCIGYNHHFEPPYILYYKWGAAFLALNGSISFAVFHREDEILDFWNFNCQTFIRLLTGILYTGVLFLGLAGALFAVHNLFSIEVKSEVYMRIFVFLGSIYLPLYVLGGFKENLNDYRSDHFYPKGLKLFTVYVLIPLIVVYLVILYAYGIKIMIQWELPKGWVSQLVLWYAIAGTLAFLLVYPLKEKDTKNWVVRFTRLFYYLLVPLLFLLFAAIFVRISEYGITIDRYIVSGLAFWLAGITLYFLLSKKDNITYYPMSLAALFLISLTGPWGMDQLPANNQLSKLKQVIAGNASRDLDGASIINYLANNHSFDYFNGLENNTVNRLLPGKTADTSRFYFAQKIIKAYSFKETFKTSVIEFLSLGYNDYLAVTQIPGSVLIVNFSLNHTPATLEKDGYKLEVTKDKIILQDSALHRIQFDLNKKLNNDFPMPIKQDANELLPDGSRPILIITAISGPNSDSLSVNEIKGSIYLKQ